MGKQKHRPAGLSEREVLAWIRAHRSERSGDCLIFTGSKNKKGYGGVRFGDTLVAAHRLAYAVAKGMTVADLYARCERDGLIVMHTCDTPECINPDHLRLGTHKDNTQDAKQKGRLASGERHGLAMLTNAQVAEIRQRYAQGGVTQQALADAYGSTRPTVSAIVRGISRK